MGIFQFMANATAKAVGLDVNYRERYQKAHPEDPECQMCMKQLHWDSKDYDEFRTKPISIGYDLLEIFITEWKIPPCYFKTFRICSLS